MSSLKILGEIEPTEVGGRLRVERRRNSLRTPELASLLGVSDGTVRSIECGRADLSFQSLIRLAQTQLDLHFILTGRKEQVASDEDLGHSFRIVKILIEEHGLALTASQTGAILRRILDERILEGTTKPVASAVAV